MASTHPMSLWWGQDPIIIYNDGYAGIVGVNHPAAFGRRAQDQWHDAWPTLKRWYDEVWNGGSVYFEDYLFTLTRHGYSEVQSLQIFAKNQEAYFTWFTNINYCL
jgi:hypothetical protein